MYGGYELFKAPENDSFVVIGADAQILQLTLQPGSVVTTETGALVHMSADVNPAMECGGMSPACKRCCSGEGCCLVNYTNNGAAPGHIGLTPSFPAKVVPCNLDELGGELQVKNGGYFTSAGKGTVEIDIKFICNPLICCCGGQGASMQTIRGTGWVFLAAGGTILEKVLGQGEVIIVDSESVVGFNSSVTMDVRRTGGCMTMCCGGEGMYNTTLTGPGRVWLQSMSFSKLKAVLAPPKSAGMDRGGGGGGGDGGGGGGGE